MGSSYLVSLIKPSKALLFPLSLKDLGQKQRKRSSLSAISRSTQNAYRMQMGFDNFRPSDTEIDLTEQKIVCFLRMPFCAAWNHLVSSSKTFPCGDVSSRFVQVWRVGALARNSIGIETYSIHDQEFVTVMGVLHRHAFNRYLYPAQQIHSKNQGL